MAQLDPRYAQSGYPARTGAALDEGLRSYMLGVYNYMAAGVALTTSPACDISGWGSFLFMGLIGIILASIVNIFLQSSGLQYASSCSPTG